MEQNIMPEGYVTSTGIPGEPDFARSDKRVYQTLPHVVRDPNELIDTFNHLYTKVEELGRRRAVLKTVCDNETAQRLVESGSPVEAVIPLDLIYNFHPNSIVIMGKNIHEDDPESLREMSTIAKFWQDVNTLDLAVSPYERVHRVVKARNTIVSTFREEDIDNLVQIWRPFGWKKSGLEELHNQIEQGNIIFSGVKDRSGALVSACLIEGATFGGIRWLEGSEYGTLDNREGKGYCSAAVVAAHARALDAEGYWGLGLGDISSLETRPENSSRGLPVIASEFNAKARSDVVGYHTGMIVPLYNSHLPILHHNVAVLDRKNPNDLRWRNLGDDEKVEKYRDAYTFPYRYTRNFVPGILPQESIHRHYTPDTIQAIKNFVE